jgi:hypothetical protein
MQTNSSAWTEFHDLEYRCHFIGASGVVDGVRLFSSADDATAGLEAVEHLRERAGAKCVELWKDGCLIGTYLSAP